MSNLRVACTAITKRIQAGRINKAGDSFIGEPVDVTSDVLKAIIDKVGVGNFVTVNENGAPAYEIEVRRVASPTGEKSKEGGEQ